MSIEQTAAQGEQNKLDCGIDPPLMAPDAHQEKHGNDLDFPKQIKEQEIGGHEQAHDAGFQK